MLSVSAISNVNQSVQSNVQNNTNFKGRTLLPPEVEDMFIKATKQEQNNMLKQIAKLYGMTTTTIAGLLGLDKIMKKDKEPSQLIFVDYPIKLKKDIKIKLPNGEKLDLEKALANGTECKDKLTNKEKMIVFDPYADKEKVQTLLPNIPYETYKGVNLEYKNILTISENGNKYWGKSSSYEDSYFAEPNSYEKGHSKIIKFENIPLNQEIDIISDIPYKFTIIPKGSEVKKGGDKTTLQEDMVFMYKYPDEYEMRTIPNFLNVFEPTNSETEKIFEEMYAKTVQPKQLAEEENLQKLAGFVINRPNSESCKYTKGDLTVRNVFYEPGYSYTAPMKEETLVKISKAYDGEVKKNPALLKYKTSISLLNGRDKKLVIYLTDKNARPWQNNDIRKEGELKDGEIYIDLSDIN